MIGYIYKIVNLINGKIYIGQTSRTIEQRYKEHLNEAFKYNNSKPLYQAMRKHGAQNFKIECLETVTIDKLNEREIYYIKLFNSIAILGHGYNLNYGGEGNSANYELINSLWDLGYSMAEICEKSGHSRVTVKTVLKNYSKYSVKAARERGVKYQNTDRCRRIYQYSPSGEYCAEYESVFAAAKELKISVGNIQVALSNPGTIAFGYQWSYLKFESVAPIQHKPRKYKQKVVEIAIDGNILGEYQSAADAGRALGLNADYVRIACKRADHKYFKLDRYFKYKE